MKRFVQRAIKRHDLIDRIASFNLTCDSLSTNPLPCPAQATIDLTAAFTAKEQRVSLRGGALWLRPKFQSFCDAGIVRLRVAVLRVQDTHGTLATIPALFDPANDDSYTDTPWMRFPQERVWFPKETLKLNGFRLQCPTRAIGNLGLDGAPIPCEDLEWCTDPTPCLTANGEFPDKCGGFLQNGLIDLSLDFPGPQRFSMASLLGRRELHLKEYQRLVLVTAWAQSTTWFNTTPTTDASLEITGSCVLTYHGDAQP